MKVDETKARYIDANTLKKLFKESPWETYDREAICREIDNAPTAFDLEQVMEDLEHESFSEHDESWKWKYDEAVDECIHIVKRGVTQ